MEVRDWTRIIDKIRVDSGFEGVEREEGYGKGGISRGRSGWGATLFS